MAAVISHSIGQELVEALGLEGQQVTEVTISFPLHGFVNLTVGFLATEAQAKGVIEIIKQYELHEKQETAV